MGDNNVVPGTTMARTVGDIRKSFDKADRMNCRDILDLIECIDFMRTKLDRIQKESCIIGYESGNTLVEALALEALRVSA